MPLIISYELDPCDALKAAELAAGDGYVKTEFEDVASIARGITGEKGCVHLHFGDPLESGLDVPSVVAAIDEQMVRHYRLYPTNAWAWERLYLKSPFLTRSIFSPDQSVVSHLILGLNAVPEASAAAAQDVRQSREPRIGTARAESGPAHWLMRGCRMRFARLISN